MTVPQGWRKSSHSSANSNCVEVANTLAAVRDSKSPAGPALAANLGALVAAVKEGSLDRG